jgi:uncharacterized membrane protein
MCNLCESFFFLVENYSKFSKPRKTLFSHLLDKKIFSLNWRVALNITILSSSSNEKVWRNPRKQPHPKMNKYVCLSMEEKLIKVTYGAFTYKKTLMKLLNIYYFRQIILMIFFVFAFGEFEMMGWGLHYFFGFSDLKICDWILCFLTIFLISRAIPIIEQSRSRDVIYGCSLVGSSARGPPVFQVLLPCQISSQYL